MSLLAELLISVFLVVAGVFGVVGSIGLVKLDDTMRRLHGPTKATTLGVGGALVSSMAYFYFAEGKVSFHELLIALFLFLTAPITANFIAKAYLHLNVDETDLPETDGRYGWALYDEAPIEDRPIDTK